LFVHSAVGQAGYSARLTTDPLQQTLAVGIQLGLVGIAVLWAMWLAHLLLFRGNTLPEWIGLVVVAQTIVGSLLNSHLFDFTQGWIYVFAVGIAGGMVQRMRCEQDGVVDSRAGAQRVGYVS
jgi:O-antigen ligase